MVSEPRVRVHCGHGATGLAEHSLRLVAICDLQKAVWKSRTFQLECWGDDKWMTTVPALAGDIRGRGIGGRLQ